MKEGHGFMYFSPEIETAFRDEIEKVQLNRLRETVRRVYDRVPMYRKRLDEAGVRPQDIRSLADLERIPFTVKDDLRRNYPFGMIATPMRDVVRIHASSGTTGKPTVVGYTKADLDMWSTCMARLIMATGVGPDDIAQVAFGYGLFTGAFGLHYALEKVGCAVIPMSAGNTEKQLMIMKDFGVTVLICTPSYALYIAESAEKLGMDPGRDLKLRVGLFGAEASSEAMRQETQKKLGLLATDNYGLSEVIGPGVSGECACQCGMHINEDHFIPEIVDPDTGRALPIGERGELVLTAVTKEALPILRYRTKDLTRLIPERCACGRTTMRMEKVTGRIDDMLIIRGVNVFPSQVETALMDIEEVGPSYEIVVTREGYLDHMEVRVELNDSSLLERFSQLEALENRIRQRMRALLGLDVSIRLVERQSLKRFEGKAKRVTDLRKI